MTPIEALKMASDREENSIALYSKFIKEHSSVRDIFEFLLNEEYKHK